MTEAMLVGGGRIGETLAVWLATDTRDALFLSEDEDAVERVAATGATALTVSPSAPVPRDREAIADVDLVIMASREDGWNLLGTQLLRQTTEHCIALVNDPNNVTAFAEAGVEPVCATTTLAAALDRHWRNGDPDHHQPDSLRANGSDGGV